MVAFASHALLTFKLDPGEGACFVAKGLLLFQIEGFSACVEALLLPDRAVHQLFVVLATLVALHVLVLA